MREEKLENLLNELSEATGEEVPAGLAGEIKGRIPERLGPHRLGIDTINIMIDLRVSKLAAAAVIIITIILSASLLGGGDAGRDNLLKESRLLIKYCLGGENATRDDVVSGLSRFYEYWTAQGKDVVYYGDYVDVVDSNDIMLHWKHSDGEYRVIFGDFRVETVSADELVKLQSDMLHRRIR